MGEVVGCEVGLQSQLKLGDNLLVDGNLEGDIGDGNFLGESALDLDQAILDSSFCILLINEIPGINNGLNDIFHVDKDTLSPDHVGDAESDLGKIGQLLLQTLLVGLFLPIKDLLDRVPLLPGNVLAFEEHLFLDSGHGFWVGIVGIVLEASLVTHTMVQTGVLD